MKPIFIALALITFVTVALANAQGYGFSSPLVASGHPERLHFSIYGFILPILLFLQALAMLFNNQSLVKEEFRAPGLIRVVESAPTAPA